MCGPTSDDDSRLTTETRWDRPEGDHIMYSPEYFAAEIEYRSNRAKESVRAARRRKLIRRPAVRRPADTVTDAR
ncbi:hypothetical protein GCM10027448_10010 [Nocardioides dilutus]